MSVRLKFEGLEELKTALRNLPYELSGQGQEIVFGSADDAATEIRAAYPARTKNLRRGVSVMKSSTAFATRATVKNTSPLAFVFENGTQARHTTIGANRGSMPPGHVFVPRVMRHRRSMFDRLKTLLQAFGLTVSGEAS